MENLALFLILILTSQKLATLMGSRLDTVGTVGTVNSRVAQQLAKSQYEAAAQSVRVINYAIPGVLLKSICKCMCMCMCICMCRCRCLFVLSTGPEVLGFPPFSLWSFCALVSFTVIRTLFGHVKSVHKFHLLSPKSSAQEVAVYLKHIVHNAQLTTLRPLPQNVFLRHSVTVCGCVCVLHVGLIPQATQCGKETHANQTTGRTLQADPNSRNRNKIQLTGPPASLPPHSLGMALRTISALRDIPAYSRIFKDVRHLV